MDWKAFLDEVLLDGLLDTLKLLPFLFLTYLLMEFIEHRASDKAERFMQKAGAFGPAVGGLLGLVPQCGFSSAAANLYTGRVITTGTLIAVFLSTSDEMLPLLIGGSMPLGKVALVLGYKAGVAILVGFLADLLLRLLHKHGEKIDIDEICKNDNCHCERGILHSAIHHTLTITLFVFLITLALNALIFFLGEERLGSVLNVVPGLSYIVAAFFGLIPNCAASIALTKLATDGLISTGAMLSGLFPAAGVGILVLLKQNKHPKENLLILLSTVATGILFGLLADLIGVSVV